MRQGSAAASRRPSRIARTKLRIVPRHRVRRREPARAHSTPNANWALRGALDQYVVRRPEILDAVDRMDGELPHVDALQHAQRNVGAGAAAAPHLAIELGLRAHAVAADAEDDVADLDAGLVAGAVRRDPRDHQPPLHLVGGDAQPGPGGPARRPFLTRSARIGFSTSIGTNMLPGSCVSPAVASRTISEPTPTSLRSRLDERRAAPVRVGGEVKIACSSRYSQLPVNGRSETTYASVTSLAPCVIDDHHRIVHGELARFAERHRRRHRAARRRARARDRWRGRSRRRVPAASRPCCRRPSRRRLRRSDSRSSGSDRRRR